MKLVPAKDVHVGMIYLDIGQWGDEIPIARIAVEIINGVEYRDLFDEDGNTLVGLAGPDELIELAE
jgi:hypothetical protein